MYAFGLAGCAQVPVSTTFPPIIVKNIDGSDYQIILSEKAAQRLGIKESIFVFELPIGEQSIEREINFAANTSLDPSKKNSFLEGFQLDQVDVENIDKSKLAQISLENSDSEELIVKCPFGRRC